MEWARFRKYARRMRELRQCGTPDFLSLEVFLVMQHCTINKPLFPNLKALRLWDIEGMSIQFIPFFLSPSTTSISLSFKSNLPEAMIASTITILPILCPNLQAISLETLQTAMMITTAISGMLLVTNRNTLQELDVDSPLTKEASEVLYELPNLRHLSVAIERETPLPSASLPNLAFLTIHCNNEDGWPRLFHGATFGRLKYIIFYLQSEQIGDFLGAFERAALSSFIQNTLLTFSVFIKHSWNQNYYSLLPFTRLVDLEIEFSCDGGCASRVDDDIIISLSRAMPKLQSLGLGNAPCRQITTGVTTKGLLALAHYCKELWTLRVHLQVASLSDPLVIPEMVPTTRPTASWTADCALVELEVGETLVPEGSTSIIALTLHHIFPELCHIVFTDERWEEVEDAINRSRKIIDCSSKQLPLATPSSFRYH